MELLDPAERAELEALANVGEIVGPLTHEINNFLNTLLLQVAVLEQSASDAVRKDLAGLKQQARSAAALVRAVQHYRRHHPAPPRPGDLNRAVVDAVAGARSGPSSPSAAIEVTASAGVPPVRAAAADLRRLTTFLVCNAVMTGGGAVTLRTEPSAAGAALVLEVAGPNVDPAFQERLTATTVSGQDGAAGLELAACRSLARRLGGELRVTPRPDGGVTVVVDLPQA